MQDIREYIKLCTVKRKISQTELAKRTGQSKQNMYEKYSRNVFKISELLKVAEALDATLEMGFYCLETGNSISKHNMQEVGITNYIKILRTKRNMTEAEFARKIGKTQQNVNNKKYKITFTSKELEEIANVFGAEFRITFIDKITKKPII